MPGYPNLKRGAEYICGFSMKLTGALYTICCLGFESDLRLTNISIKHIFSSVKKHTVETVADLIKPSKKYLYKCNCVYCNGKKVDSHTQEKHTKSKSL